MLRKTRTLGVDSRMRRALVVLAVVVVIAAVAVGVTLYITGPGT
jgi:hypothetical protein